MVKSYFLPLCFHGNVDEGGAAAPKSGLSILTIHKTVEINPSFGDLINLSHCLCEMSVGEGRGTQRAREWGGEEEREDNKEVEK